MEKPRIITDLSDAPAELFTANIRVNEELVRNISKKTKDKIEGCVKSYMKLFPKEYKKTIDKVNKRRWMLDDRKFGSSDGGGVVERALFEIPENLHTIIYKALDANEIKEWKGVKGSRWFAIKFKQFRTADQV